jgi:hypothetical protein
MSPEPRLATLDYLAEVAKDWAVSSFAAAEDSGFVLIPQRFKFIGSAVRRSRVPRRSREAADPLASAHSAQPPTVWARSATLTLLTDATAGATVAYEHEIVEIIGVEEDDVLVEAATVVRIPGLSPCLGRFWTVA